MHNHVMSTADYFVAKGEEKKSIEIVKNLLVANQFTIAEIANFVNVPEAFIQQVKNTLGLSQ